MSTKHKQYQANRDLTPARKLILRLKYVIFGALSLLIVFSIVYLLTKKESFGTKKESLSNVQQVQQQESSDPDLFHRIVQRTYAIDILFHQVYNAEWEGAYGAIGDAHLYAATGDQNLLSLYTNTYRLLDMYNGTWVDDRAWVCLAEMYWWDVSGRKNIYWVEDARKRYLEAKSEGRLSHHEGFWSWYNYFPGAKGNFKFSATAI